MTQKIPVTIADLELQLSSAISIGSTSFTLSSATDDDGNALPSGKYCFTVDNGSTSKEYLMGDLVGTTVSSIISISRQGVDGSAGALRAHRVGASVILTDFVTIQRVADALRGIASLDGGSPLIYDSTPTLSDGKQLATVAYVLSVVTGGTVNFSSQTISATAGESVASPNLAYLKESDQRWWKTDTDTDATVAGVRGGVVLSTAGAGAGVTIQLSGVCSVFSGLTAGQRYYASSTAAGVSTTKSKMFVGIAISSNQMVLAFGNPYDPTKDEKDAMAGGGYLGTPSSSNKFMTEAAQGTPTVRVYESIGSSDTQFDITNTAGSTYRYTYDGTGTDPNITAARFPIGTVVYFNAQNFIAANKGVFTVTNSGANFVEVTNASGVVESNKTIGTGQIVKGGLTWTKPSTLRYVKVVVVGSGAGGVGANSGTAGAAQEGGPAGGYAEKIIAAASLGATETITVGTAGLGGAIGANGSNGATSSFGSLVSCTGGTGGSLTAGTGTGGDINITGQSGGAAMRITAQSIGISGFGGGTPIGLGGAALSGAGATPGNNAKGYGAGGGGSIGGSGGGAVGGNGSGGVVIVIEY